MGRAHEVRKVAMEKTAAAKSKLYSKYGKEIYMAAKSGTPDPDTNQALKKIIEKAKKEQVTADIIKRAIEKAKGGSEESYYDVRYEGFGPGNSMLIVECLTDNVNRTIATVKNCFTKTGGKLGVGGSVLHQFTHNSVFTLPGVTEDEVLEILINNNLDISDIEEDEEGVTIFGADNDFNNIRTAISDAKPDLNLTTEVIMWLPIMKTTLEGEDLEKFDRLIAMLDELDDVQDVFHNVTL
ncbi:MAG TPA: YebC/PmpR family DNA-binding transcriptional regulator [Acholeplasmataceae bacterium]|nr:MAG: transcriptional regulator [Tenericutes bacterium GWA2_38_26]OHE30189.1 MAG: transcriptional regulator [Tenericutes bacterium GWC2_39_45]OHE32448.1 MAG: transcriptional regulator [Tenericutes bacterium GWD2_38_27]OHE40014.1 MAG: transcriptional regulator [Tenericutes bacterium GWF2_38_8]OHE40034.1 MAG: transcriptional regulator [Tenericutes bacterium GWE2_38_8]HBG32849.1 YebC/PmpR family DNA-binding transcriptional regulator [Acholeplasmataceae bacterium]